MKPSPPRPGWEWASLWPAVSSFNSDLTSVTKGRLEAFSDGMIAIFITIMVLELKTPLSANVGALAPLWPVWLSYILSYIYLGIYWNNHHHLFQAVRSINGRVLG